MALRQKFFMHMNLGGGGFLYGYEIIAPDGAVIGTKSVSRAKRTEKVSTTLRLGDQEFATVEELTAAYDRQIEDAHRDQEWEAAAP
jgi:hypothetical protein